MPHDPAQSEEGASVYYAQHDLREMFSRENASRRRTSGHTLRKYLTDAQDRKILNSFQKLNESFVLSNNNDAVIAWVQQQIAAGKADDIDATLIELAGRIVIAEKTA